MRKADGQFGWPRLIWALVLGALALLSLALLLGVDLGMSLVEHILNSVTSTVHR